MLCPSCFHERPDGGGPCPACAFVEMTQRDSRFLPYRHALRRGRYLVGEVLGKPGGFGVAYKALDTQQGAVVVIKECLLTESNQVSREAGDVRVHVNPGFQAEYDKWLQKRFREEAAHIARFGSPYIVRIIELFDENNTAYYVMPFVDGDDLATYCASRGGCLPQEEVTQLALHLLSALAEMHKQGVVHRDIKPSNILISRKTRSPVLIDFGAARDHFDGERSRSHMAVHTPGFAPIEQVNLLSNQGAWTDIYSLCATLHFCLVGEPPPKAVDRYDPDGKKRDPFVPIHQRLPEVGAGLAMVINNGLAVTPKTRLSDAGMAIRLLAESTRPPDSTEAKTATTDPAFAAPPTQASPSDTVLAAVEQPVALQPRADRANEYLGLLPAFGVVAYGALAPANFSNYMTEWAGLAVLVNVVAWLVWRSHRKAGVGVAAPPAPPATTGLGPKVLESQEHRVPGIEVSLLNEGFPPLREVLRAGAQVVIGRNPKLATISVPNDMLSGRHVQVQVLEDGSFTLQDLGTTNSTYVHDRHAAGGRGAWKRITNASGHKGRFTLGPPEAGGVLLEIRQVHMEP